MGETIKEIETGIEKLKTVELTVFSMENSIKMFSAGYALLGLSKKLLLIHKVKKFCFVVGKRFKRIKLFQVFYNSIFLVIR